LKYLHTLFELLAVPHLQVLAASDGPSHAVLVSETWACHDGNESTAGAWHWCSCLQGAFTAPYGWAVWGIIGAVLSPFVVGTVANIVSSTGRPELGCSGVQSKGLQV
jgi:hypothetical protein